MELQAEGMPGPQDPERFSFWVWGFLTLLQSFAFSLGKVILHNPLSYKLLQLANLLNLRPALKLELLRLRDTREVQL